MMRHDWFTSKKDFDWLKSDMEEFKHVDMIKMSETQSLRSDCCETIKNLFIVAREN